MCLQLLSRTQLQGRINRPPHPSYASFDGLCIDILDAILSHITWPLDLRSAALVCRSWHDRAATLLYATLPVLSSRPAQTLALLDQLEASPHRASLVRTVVFEPQLVRGTRSPVFSLARADELCQLAKRLANVLPQLTNVDCVRIGGGAHPLLMSTYMSYPRFRRKCGYYALHLLGDESAGTTWHALAAPSLHLERMTARLWGRCFLPAHALHNVRSLVLRGAGFDDWSASRSWAPALEHLHRLEALLLVDLDADECDMLGKAVMPRLRTLVLMNVRGPVCIPESLEHLAILGNCAWLAHTRVKLPRLRSLRIVSRGDAVAANDFVSRQHAVLEFSCVTRTQDDSVFILSGTPFEGEHIVYLRNSRSWIQRLRIRSWGICLHGGKRCRL